MVITMHLLILMLAFLVGAVLGAGFMGLCLGRGVNEVLRKITEDFFGGE